MNQKEIGQKVKNARVIIGAMGESLSEKRDRLDDFKRALAILEDQGMSCDKEKAAAVEKQFLEEIKELEERRDLAKAEIAELQKECEHEHSEFISKDERGRWFRCDTCGKYFLTK